MKRDTTAYGAERPAWDKNDCSVRALAVACGVPYAVASIAFTVLGRRLKAGTELQTSVRLHEEILGMLRIKAVEGMDLGTFMRYAVWGRYVIHKTGHAFAVVDGVLHDWEGTTRAGTRILRVWRVGPKALCKMQELAKLV